MNKNLVDEISAKSASQDIAENTEILILGQYVKVIPLVVDGLIKVFSSRKDNDLCCITSDRVKVASCPSQPV